MRYRPLKGADFYAKELYYGKGDGDRIKVFKAENVKSAVQGLLEDLERAKQVTCDENKKAHLGYCIYLVKKWLADVISGEEEE